MKSALARPRVTFPSVVTASRWTSVYETLRTRARTARESSDLLPRLTNAEAVALVRAWRSAATTKRFPLWYQFAAVAYAWDPPDNDVFDTKRGGKLYPPDIGAQLWLTLAQLAQDLETDDVPDPRVTFDDTAFNDVDTVSSVRAALQQDGAQALFKAPRDKAVTGAESPTTKKSNFGAIALILGLLWLASKKKATRRRRRK